MIVRVSPSGSPTQWKATLSPRPASTWRSTQLYGGVQPAADEPLGVGQVPLEGPVPVVVPGQPGRLALPPAEGVGGRLLVDAGLGVGPGGKLGRRVEPTRLVEQRGEVPLPPSTCRSSRSSPCSAPGARHPGGFCYAPGDGAAAPGPGPQRAETGVRTPGVGALGGASGTKGTMARLKVSLTTPPNEAYQAAAAVAMPSQPPVLVTPTLDSKAPMVSRTKVAVRRTNTATTAPDTRNEAMVM